MSTVSSGAEEILRLRRQLPKTATNAKTSREVFGDKTTKLLLIPRFINNYNYYMGGVDQSDQLRSYYNTQRTHRKTWKPLWHFLLDTTITNYFQIHRYRPPITASPTYQHQYTQKEFRTELAVALFDYSERLTKAPQALPKPLTEYVIPDTASEHHHIVLSKTKFKSCIICKTVGRRPTDALKRKPLGELSHNINSTTRPKKRKLEMKRTSYGCNVCKQYICKTGSYWSDHIKAIQ